MTDEERQARQSIDAALATLFNELREYMHDQLNDKFSEEEAASPELARRLALYYAQRMIVEIQHDEHGRKAVARAFDSMFYQIAARHIGPRDFANKAKPYDPT